MFIHYKNAFEDWKIIKISIYSKKFTNNTEHISYIECMN